MFTSKPAFFLDDGDIRLVARLDDTSPRSNLISDAYQGLSHSLTDQKWLSHVLVSFIDKQDIERTFLFETTDAPSANSTVPLHNGIWNTASGAYQEAFSVDKSLSAAFRVYLNDSQAMFFISKGKVIITLGDCFATEPNILIYPPYIGAALPWSRLEAKEEPCHC